MRLHAGTRTTGFDAVGETVGLIGLAAPTLVELGALGLLTLGVFAKRMRGVKRRAATCVNA